ncbi:MAG: hypothetical protein E7505_00375 [Ruminococcus sp.]|nr:hypothetical protein [Ruminococcus sp.]
MKLSGGQLWAVLFMLRAFNFICSPDAYSLQRIGGTAISVFIQFLIVVPVIRVCREKTAGVTPGKAGVFPALYFIFTGMLAIGRMLDITASENFAISKNIILVLLLVFTALYCSKLGMRAAGRAAAVISGMFIFFLAVLLLTSVPEIRADNLTGDYDNTSVFAYALKDFAESSEIPAVLILSLFTYEGRAKGIYIYFGSKLLLVGLVTLLGASVSGNVSVLADYPFFELTSFSDLFGVQRSDVLFVTVCTLGAVLTVTVCVIAASEFLKKYFGGAKLLCLAFMTAGGFFLRGDYISGTELFFTIVFIIVSILYMISASSEVRKAESV